MKHQKNGLAHGDEAQKDERWLKDYDSDIEAFDLYEATQADELFRVGIMNFRAKLLHENMDEAEADDYIRTPQRNYEPKSARDMNDTWTEAQELFSGGASA